MDNIPPPPFDYLPDPPLAMSKEALLAGFYADNKDDKRIMWKAYVCKKCHAVNKRRFWNRLECRRCGDVLVLDIKLPDLSFEDIVDSRFTDLNDNSDIPDIEVSNGATDVPHPPTNRFIVKEFALGDSDRVLLLLPKRDEIYKPGGAEDLFTRLWKEVQSGDLELVRCQRKSNSELTAWFGINIGEKYENSLKINSVSMADANSVIKKIHDSMADGVESVLGVRPEFNELRSIGMYPNMALNWQLDREKGISGDVIASISLGGTGKMSFRLSDRHYIGRVEGVANVDVPIVPGTQMEEEKRELKQLFDDDQVLREEYVFQQDEILKKWAKKPKPILEFPLPGTGAIVIQQGMTLNKYYVLEVVNQSLARLVTTGRKLTITPEGTNDANEADEGSEDEEGDGDRDEEES